MNAAIGDFFPDKEKHDFASRNIIAGNVILCHSDIADKDKRLVIIGISSDKKRVATLCFNTKKYFTENKFLSSLEIHFNAKGRDYLEHDSYLKCSHIEIIPYQRIYERLFSNPEDLLGTMAKHDLDSVCTSVVNAHTAVKKNVHEFDLTGYILHSKP